MTDGRVVPLVVRGSCREGLVRATTDGMIVIAGSVRIKAESRDAAVRAALAMAEASQREDGCRAYRFSVDLADPTLVYVHEEWESAAALERHFATPHMAAFRASLPALVAAPASITRYEIAAAAKMA